MAADVTIQEWNGTSGAEVATDKTTGGTIRFKKADNALVNSADPMPKPASGQVERSMLKYYRLHMGATGPSGSITDVRFYTTGNMGTGMTEYILTTNPGSYATPTVPANDTGATDASTYTSGSPKNMGDGPYTTTNADFGDWAALYAKRADTAVGPGVTPSNQTNVWQWSET